MANNLNRAVQFRLDDEEFRKLENLAEINGIKKSEVIRKSIDNYFDTYNREGAKYKPLILNNIKTMKLLLESDRFHKEELKREVARLLCIINQ
ncbi:ribbon-helix-helix protein, CopG family [Phascolarctobacterium succinatutens]|uniref:ribbon-helix-helix protein, CopG family n=1 Tax=Phascolarctobacterium succinatutens TaxID=626940 RepID=UPI003FD84B03